MHVEWKTVTGNCLWCRTRVVSWLLAPLEEFGILATSVNVMEMGEWMGCNVLELSFRASGWGPLQTVHCQNVKNTILLNTVQDVNSLFTPPTRTTQNWALWRDESCSCRRCEHNCRQDKTVLSCLDPVSNFQVFSSPQYIWDWTVANWKLGWDKTKLSCLVANWVHTVLSCPCRRCEQAITLYGTYSNSTVCPIGAVLSKADCFQKLWSLLTDYLYKICFLSLSFPISVNIVSMICLHFSNVDAGNATNGMCEENSTMEKRDESFA